MKIKHLTFIFLAIVVTMASAISYGYSAHTPALKGEAEVAALRPLKPFHIAGQLN